MPMSMCVTGTFGRVYFGTLLSHDSDDALDQPVLIKTVTGKSCSSRSLAADNFVHCVI